jgi:polyphosphate kinase
MSEISASERMTPEIEVASPDLKINLDDPKYYFNRELSWLEFNRRVMQEAFDSRTPLLERLKFAAIFGSNLDEFFMVRVASLQRQLEAGVMAPTFDGMTPQQQLDEISLRLHEMVARLQALFANELRPQLASEGIHIMNYADLNEPQQSYVQNYFEEHVFPILTPLAVDPTHPFPVMGNLTLNLAVVIEDPDNGNQLFARVKVPDSLPRFVPIPPELNPQIPSVWIGITLEDIIAEHLVTLFPGMNILDQHLFRITRDTDLSLQEEEADDLAVIIAEKLSTRRISGSVVRFQIAPTMSTFVKQTLIKGMNIDSNDIYIHEGMLAMRDLMSFAALPLPHLKDKPWTPTVPKRLHHLMADEIAREATGEDIFGIIRQGDLLVHHPYESFTASTEYFITHAAHDPAVQAIKITLYRTSNDSLIVNALIDAAQNGKQVAALVEIKARFDEASNLTWAQKLEEAGVHVVYGILGLKTHTKVVLVLRKEGIELRRYFHIGTGNYNSKTSKIYTDLGLLSCRNDLGADLTDLFNFLTGFSKQKLYRKLLVAPMSLRSRMMEMIQREVQHCQNGGSGQIIVKMNALTDPPIIKALYEASQAGVNIDLIVRGMCCLLPGIPGVSEHIRVISIVGRYLEHSRIVYFHNNGQAELYIGSADWMPRNLDRRVEAVTPVEDPSCATELKELLDILLADNRQAWELQSDGSYRQRQPTPETEKSAQNILMERCFAAHHGSNTFQLD